MTRELASVLLHHATRKGGWNLDGDAVGELSSMLDAAVEATDALEARVKQLEQWVWPPRPGAKT